MEADAWAEERALPAEASAATSAAGVLAPAPAPAAGELEELLRATAAMLCAADAATAAMAAAE